MSDSRGIEGIDRWPVLSSAVDGFTSESLLCWLSATVSSGQRAIVANHNLNSLALFQSLSEFRSFYELADAVFIDGAPVVWLAKLAGGKASMENRLGVLDWIWKLFAIAERNNWRIVHLGSVEPTIGRARSAIKAGCPGLNLVTIDGYFDMWDPEANAEVVKKVTDARPDLLLVGMGMPRQESWILANIRDIPSCVTITVGGILGYIGGDRPTCPRWIGRLGLEWVYRLCTEPTRLWRRYLLESWVLVRPVACEVLRGLRRIMHSCFGAK